MNTLKIGNAEIDRNSKLCLLSINYDVVVDSIRRLVGKRDVRFIEMEYLVQETFLEFVRRPENFHFVNLKELIASLKCVAHNKLNNFRRTFMLRERKYRQYLSFKRHDPNFPKEPEASERSAQKRIEDLERKIILKDAINSLEPEEALLAELYYFNDFSLSEIAELFKKSPQTLSKKLSLMAHKLLVYLKRNHADF